MTQRETNPPWLEKRYGDRLNHIRDYVTRRWHAKTTIKYHTPHGPDHCRAVEDQLHKLIPGDNNRKLSEGERFLLLAAAWLHDLASVKK